MPAPVTSRWLATLGLVLLTPVALGLVRGSLGLDVAAVRALVLIAGLFVVERFVVPVAKLLVFPGRRRADRVPTDRAPGPGVDAAG